MPITPFAWYKPVAGFQIFKYPRWRSLRRIKSVGNTRKDRLVKNRRTAPHSFFSQHCYGAFFFCVAFVAGSGELAAQTTPPDVPAQVSKQTSPEKSQQSQMGGVNTGGAHAAILDEEHRPITAGGFVKMGPIIFQDIAQKAGLTTWKHTMGMPDKRYIIETNGSGVGLIDYDNDGWLDIYFVNGSTVEALNGKTVAP